MPPEVDRRRLSRLEVLLAEALIAQDWTRIGELDTLIGQCMRRLHSSGALTEQVLAELAPLKRLHGRALGACADECHRLKTILDRHTSFGEGRQAYSLANIVQGEH
ncbi:hypothetical protein PS627_04265 [Pseudomonas fluorescens]|uniref:hypothetical protein n=1 Tax=Pseudomonas fluorescens TaxID=294 RepID=UPI00125B8F48|nr:hypothetical protein [Pseudomonas fluorescens]CAG8871069.1 hypothetical protein PS627_04265 [Pseudomonas fluorescens]